MKTSVIFLGHRFPESNLSHIPRTHGSRIKPQSWASLVAQWLGNPPANAGGHRFEPWSGKIPHKKKKKKKKKKTSVMFAGHGFSTIKPQSCSQGTDFQKQTSVMFPGHRVFRIKPQSCFQATGFLNPTDVMFPGHRGPDSNHSHVPRPEGSTIKPQPCSQATGFQQSNLSHVPVPQVSRI